MLFATQNPPGIYGGRKALSRAFRNRFLELHFDEIPKEELETILHKRCKLAPSYCTKLVQVFKDLQNLRQVFFFFFFFFFFYFFFFFFFFCLIFFFFSIIQGTKIFAGKQGFITLRDLFRWAYRDPDNYEQLAYDGYMLLAERARRPHEKEIVKTIIQQHLKV